MEKNIPQKHYLFIFYGLLVVLLLDRFLHLYFFSFQYADSDQTILWLGAVEMLQGHFHEPAFYGQAYNTMFEALLAVPLLVLGMPVYYALPIITALLAVFPFVLFAILCRKHNRLAAIIFLALPLVLPVEYVLFTQLPRGFITGIFGASIAVAFLLFSKEVKLKHIVLSAFFGGFALVLNPNSIFLLFPVYLYVFIKSTKKLQVVFGMAGGVLLPLVWQLYILWFYKTHPHYSVHNIENNSFSIDNFLGAISHFHELFYGLFPILIFAGAGIIPALLFIAYKLYKKGEKVFSLVLLITLFCVGFTMFFYKINDGTASIFFPYSRMFLALPLVAGIGLFFLFKGSRIKAKPMYWFLGSIAFVVTLKFFTINDRIGWNIHNNSGYVEVFKIDDLKQKYTQIQSIADSINVTMLIINEKKDALNYGVMALSNSKLKTISLYNERKVWLLEQQRETDDKSSLNFLFWCENENQLMANGLQVKKVADNLPLYQATTQENPVLFFYYNSLNRHKPKPKKH